MAGSPEKSPERQVNENGGDSGKYVRYTNEQVEALERVYVECPKPSSVRRTQLIKECPLLANIEPKQIKVWFQNRRCRERQRMEASRLQSMNTKLTALNKLLMEENEMSTKKISQLTVENAILRQQLSNYQGLLKLDANGHPAAQVPAQAPDAVQAEHAPLKLDLQGGGLMVPPGSNPIVRHREGLQHPAANGFLSPPSLDTSQESVVTEGKPESSTAGLLTIAEEILAEFLDKATGSSIDFVEMPGIKHPADFLGRVAVSTGGVGVAARAAGLVALESTKVAELLKDRMAWMRDCRRCDVLGGFRTATGGSVELIYTQMYAPTTLAAARDLCTLRYTTLLDEGGVVICERSLSSSHGGASMPAVPSFVRAQMLSSGFLIRPCNDACIVIAVDHMDLEPWSVPEVLRPLYESSPVLAQRVTLEALRHLRRVAQEAAGTLGSNSAHVAAWRSVAARVATGFNEAVNGFADDHWMPLPSDGLDDVSVAARATLSTRTPGAAPSLAEGPGPAGGGVLCAKASMLLQNVPPGLLIRSLRDQRAEWADCDIDADAAAAVRASLGRRGEAARGQLPLPLAYAVDQEEFLELVKLEASGQSNPEAGDSFLLQLCSGADEGSAAPAQLVFAPVDAASTADSVPLLPSGFRILPLDYSPAADGHTGRTLDLTSTLEGQAEGGRRPDGSTGSLRSVLTIAFQFVYEGPSRDAVAAVARQYVRSVVAAVQRVAMALAPPQQVAPTAQLPSSPEALILCQRIMQSYRLHMGTDLVRHDGGDASMMAEAFWSHRDAIICVAWKTSPELLFANQAGLEMMESSTGGLQEVPWEKTYDDEGRKCAYAAFSQVMQQGSACLPPGVRLSRNGRAAGYERAIAWKVVDEEGSLQCIAFMHIHWSFMS